VDILTYLFWPNPSNAAYGDPKVVAALLVVLALVLASIAIRVWRRKATNPITKKLSKSWASACFWFGVVALVLIVARVESIQFISMRVLWAVWGALCLLYVYFQFRRFAKRHYEVLPAVRSIDPREKYLPKRKH
jgi:ABC-type uncharacterized transport system fused permease/ATPase subunit